MRCINAPAHDADTEMTINPIVTGFPRAWCCLCPLRSCAAVGTCCGGYSDEGGGSTRARNSDVQADRNTDANGFQANNGVFSFELPDVE